ncbi:MAG: hypothetical protein G01um101425_540 [Candidatus Peregrinibacteria bacterium Gr01-1014_25]|nr:MAG: hypothetical protein G01um101425_540 [Candidatus Peregrinibacteria bacterium Gr01-1014_25]
MTIPSTPPSPYTPLIATARLYAGWLLAWYALVFVLGGYQATGLLPLDVSWLEGIYRSPLVLLCAAGTFLFLLLSDLRKLVGPGSLRSVMFVAIWIGLVLSFARMT